MTPTDLNPAEQSGYLRIPRDRRWLPADPKRACFTLSNSDQQAAQRLTVLWIGMRTNMPRREPLHNVAAIGTISRLPSA
jgi:hypothetical protein